MLLQPRPVELVAGGRALIGDELAGRALALVQAKCLYALEVQAGERPGPHSDDVAMRSARSRIVTQHTCAPGAAGEARGSGARPPRLGRMTGRATGLAGERAGMRERPLPNG